MKGTEIVKLTLPLANAVRGSFLVAFKSAGPRIPTIFARIALQHHNWIPPRFDELFRLFG